LNYAKSNLASTGRKQILESDVLSKLPDGAIAKLLESTGWDNAEAPLTARITIEIPNFASVTEKRLIAPSLLFSTIPKDMLDTNFRRYPIAFRFPFEESDELRLKLPEGYTLDVLPYRRRAGLKYAGYETASVMEGNILVTRRKLHLDEILFPPEQFDELKSLFSVVLAGDGGQAILEHGPAESKAGPGN
jgi:hypothetical protein